MCGRKQLSYQVFAEGESLYPVSKVGTCSRRLTLPCPASLRGGSSLFTPGHLRWSPSGPRDRRILKSGWKENLTRIPKKSTDGSSGQLAKIDPKLIVLDQNAEPSLEIEKLIQEISQRHGVDPELVKAVAKPESNFNPRAVSHKGALGIMQLIPETAKRFGVANVWDPKQNIEGGVRFLKFLIGMFPDNLPYILAAYNAGENAVLKYRGIPPYRETQAYVRKITQVYKGDHFLIVSSQPERIVSYRKDSGRVVHSNLDNAFR